MDLSLPDSHDISAWMSKMQFSWERAKQEQISSPWVFLLPPRINMMHFQQFPQRTIPLLYNRSHVICLSGSEFRRHMSLTGVPYWHGCLLGRKGILARWEMLIRHIIPTGAVANDATMSSLPCISHLFLPGVIRICWQRSRWAVHQYVWQTKIYSLQKVIWQKERPGRSKPGFSES